MAYTLVLSSGGIESAVATARSAANGDTVRAINFNIGHSGSFQEYSASTKISLNYNIPIKRVNFPGLQDMFAGIMDAELLADEGDTRCDTEISFLPGLIQLSILYGRQSGASSLVIGLTNEQVGAHTDGPSSIHLLAEASNKYNPNLPKISIELPFENLKKYEVIKEGLSLGVDFSMTWSCFKGGFIHCGTCGSCLSRKDAFSAANVVDPTLYEVP